MLKDPTKSFWEDTEGRILNVVSWIAEEGRGLCQYQDDDGVHHFVPVYEYQMEDWKPYGE